MSICSSLEPKAGTGIYLAALSLSGRTDRHALVQAFDGTSAHIVNFLSSEVLATYEPHEQAFMLRTSVLERLCGELCDAVLERSASGPALESLARSNLFLVALDDRRRRFRFHQLFAQILRAELERREPELIPALHRRAYAWHRRFGTTDEAIHHAVSGRSAIMLIIAGLVGFVRTLRRNALRRCPVCDADAVEDGERIEIDGFDTCVELRCGQCGTWRRLFATHGELRRHERDVEHDRRAVEDRLRRLEAADLEALGAALRDEILGAPNVLGNAQRR